MSESQIITGNNINRLRNVMLYRALAFELKTGMKMTAKANPFAIIKKEFNLKGTKIKVLEQYKKILEDAGETI